MSSHPSPSAPRQPRKTPFVALRHHDYRLIWFGQLVSGAGSQMQFIALNYQIYELTHSPVALGLMGLVRVVPIIVFSLFAGVVADAVDRRRLLIFTQTFMMLAAIG